MYSRRNAGMFVSMCVVELPWKMKWWQRQQKKLSVAYTEIEIFSCSTTNCFLTFPLALRHYEQQHQQFHFENNKNFPIQNAFCCLLVRLCFAAILTRQRFFIWYGIASIFTHSYIGIISSVHNCSQKVEQFSFLQCCICE